MTDALIERVKKAIKNVEAIKDEWGSWSEDYDGMTRAAILAVLDHFSDPVNVRDEMAEAWTKAKYEKLLSPGRATHGVIAAAMRAARDEVSRG